MTGGNPAPAQNPARADAGQPRVRLAAVGLGRWARVMARAYARSGVVELRSCFSR
ncbi:MAG: hypothetical protein QOG05_3531, partial [Streptosporangiaceae bacterium]|nr:hypothetical protein [Streptosporangiaceae bacterium]